MAEFIFDYIHKLSPGMFLGDLSGSLAPFALLSPQPGYRTAR
jgi:hypothetical protein